MGAADVHSEGQGSLACCSSWRVGGAGQRIRHNLATEQQQQQWHPDFLLIIFLRLTVFFDRGLRLPIGVLSGGGRVIGEHIAQTMPVDALFKS